MCHIFFIYSLWSGYNPPSCLHKTKIMSVVHTVQETIKWLWENRIRPMLKHKYYDNTDKRTV